MSFSGLTISKRSETAARAGKPRNFKLVDAKTGEVIALPATRKCWDGPSITITKINPSPSPQGRIITDLNEVFVPSVIDAKILEFPASETELEAVGAESLK